MGIKNKIPEINPCIYRFLTKMGLQKGKKNFTINVAEHIGYPGDKRVELTLSPVMYNSEKNSSKWITNLDVQNKILKLLEII